MVSGDIGAKVDILLKAFMQPVNELSRPNALLVGAQTFLLLAQGQPSSQGSDNVIPEPENTHKLMRETSTNLLWSVKNLDIQINFLAFI